MKPYSFSRQLSTWLKGSGPKTVAQLDEAFAEKSFAVGFLLLLAPSALPIPTGGITNVFEIIALILAAEMIVGRRTLWLPKRWRHNRLSKAVETKALPRVIGFVRWFERFSRPRFAGLMQRPYFLRLLGLIVFIFTTSAFLAVPFSGLDTLPSLGVVLIALSMLLDDFAIAIMGLAIGIIGVAVQISVGSVALHLLGL